MRQITTVYDAFSMPGFWCRKAAYRSARKNELVVAMRCRERVRLDMHAQCAEKPPATGFAAGGCRYEGLKHALRDPRADKAEQFLEPRAAFIYIYLPF